METTVLSQLFKPFPSCIILFQQIWIVKDNLPKNYWECREGGKWDE